MGSFLSRLQSVIFAHKIVVFAVILLISGTLVTTLIVSTREASREITAKPSPYATSYLKPSTYPTLRQYNLPSVYPTSSSDSLQSRYPFNTAPFSGGYRIGNTTVYLNDLEKRFMLYFPDTIASRMSLSNWQKVADLVSADAIVLSAAVTEGVLTPRDALGINPIKVNTAREYFSKKGTSYVSGEMVTVWFYNTDPPAMGVTAAKEKTRKVIEELYRGVQTGNLSLKNAGERIKVTYELADIDPSYQTNAYVKFEFAKPGQKIIHDPSINEKLFMLPHGQLSEILIGRDYNTATNQWYDAYFTFFKITEKKLAQFDTIEKMIDARMREGMRIIL